jgi:hypothetical protein
MYIVQVDEVVSIQNCPANCVLGADVPELFVEIAERTLLISALVAGNP